MLSRSDPTYPAFPLLAFLGAIVVLIPLPWHFQAWNAGTCLFMIWTALACVNLGINSIVWNNNVINSAPVWCDISSRIIVAVAVAVPAASLCIQRRLYNIASVKTVNMTRAEKRRGIIIDLAIGGGVPVLQIVFQYIVSGHRFDIYEGIGCYVYTYNTPLAYPFSFLWPLVIAMISGCYCVLTLINFFRRRAQFNAYLTSNSSLTANRYFRLMAIASLEIVCTIPISAYGLYLNLTSGTMNPWISWEDTHFNYSKVNQFPAVIWRADTTAVISFELSRWLAPFCAFVFFAFFGFAQEARIHYRKAFLWIRSLPPFRGLFPERPLKGGVKLPNGVLEKADRRQPKHDAESLPVYSARPPRPPTFSSLSSSLAPEEMSTLSAAPYHEKIPDTPSTPSTASTASDLSYDDRALYEHHIV
ncbi:pheromone A receptor-domain-containing protein [Dichomitus squalens]|uniref:Pheromone A receptor-domain-containing protein n=1 Tax=Dichomitus squalens TaxID=114155 RepID=A0A4Q9PPA3_9APHY|nr:pheromone A receptor-domain-containing protein [Dichomitus squalens]